MADEGGGRKIELGCPEKYAEQYEKAAPYGN
jgi:hypothetical protein